MGAMPEDRAARESVAAYHEASMTELARHVSEAIDRFRAGELDVFGLDRVIHQYHRASTEVWKFCSLDDAEFTADVIARGTRPDWWERGAPKRQ